MSAAINGGYVNKPAGIVSPCFADLSLYCVIRSNSPMELKVVKIQPNCAWAGTSDCTNKVTFLGSKPTAKYKAARLRVLWIKSFGSCGTVIACWFTIQ